MRAIARTGITPNGVTALGFAGNGIAALLAARGWLVIAGAVMLASSGLDLVDGALARATGRVSRFGAVFDAVLDRYSEALVLLGVLAYEEDRGRYVQTGLVFAALTGSVLVSYVRARAETLGLSLREGLFTRAERVALVAVALLLSGWWHDALTGALWLLAVLSNLTALQRVHNLRAKMQMETSATGRESEAPP